MSAYARAWLFILATFLLTWACQLPGVLILREHMTVPPIVMGMMALGSAAPSLVALWFSVLERRTLQCAPPRRAAWSQPRWLLWACALSFNPAAHWLGSGVLYLFGQHDVKHWVYLPVRPEQLAIAVIAPLGEELGFRGYALPRLQARIAPLSASLCIGVVWALWHVPTLLVPGARGTSAIELWLYLSCFVSGSVVYTWLYNAGRGSVIGPLLAHFGIHLDNVFRASTLGDGVAPLASTAVSMVVIAAILIATARLHPATAVRALPLSAAVGPSAPRAQAHASSAMP